MKPATTIGYGALSLLCGVWWNQQVDVEDGASARMVAAGAVRRGWAARAA